MVSIVFFYREMFVASRNRSGQTQIAIQSMHGSGDHRRIIESQRGDIQFDVDKVFHEIYFCDSVNKQIGWTDYRGESSEKKKQKFDFYTSERNFQVNQCTSSSRTSVMGPHLLPFSAMIFSGRQIIHITFFLHKKLPPI